VFMIPRINQVALRGSYRGRVKRMRRQCAGIPALEVILKTPVFGDGR
jgi:hypothetical protein